jgi:hypothetical protein
MPATSLLLQLAQLRSYIEVNSSYKMLLKDFKHNLPAFIDIGGA